MDFKDVNISNIFTPLCKWDTSVSDTYGYVYIWLKGLGLLLLLLFTNFDDLSLEQNV